jgi:hypothetical protein
MNDFSHVKSCRQGLKNADSHSGLGTDVVFRPEGLIDKLRPCTQQSRTRSASGHYEVLAAGTVSAETRFNFLLAFVKIENQNFFQTFFLLELFISYPFLVYISFL